MSTIIQKYKSLIEKKKKLTLKHEFLMIDLNDSVKARKRLKRNYSKIMTDNYHNYSKERILQRFLSPLSLNNKEKRYSVDHQKEMLSLIESKKETIQKSLLSLKKNKYNLKKVNSKLSNLLK